MWIHLPFLVLPSLLYSDLFNTLLSLFFIIPFNSSISFVDLQTVYGYKVFYYGF